MKNFTGPSLYCHGGCGKEYNEFPLDVVLPDELWKRIAPRPDGYGVLCADCILKRLRDTCGATVAFLSMDRAARGDSLVGQRVRITGHCDGRTVAEEGVIDSQKIEYRIRAFNGFYRFYRDDFDVLSD